MNRFHKFAITSVAVVTLSTLTVRAGLPQTNAYDNADLYNQSTAFTTQNLGVGYGAWDVLPDASGGGTYYENGGRQVEGAVSFGVYGNTGGYDISRPLSSSITAGEFDVLTRFDTAATNLDLLNLRTGNNTSTFGGGELLSFGIVGGVDPTQLSYTDGTGFHLISGSGDARGAVWSWAIDFDTTADTYSLNVTNLSGTFSFSHSSSLELASQPVGSFAVINTTPGGSQNLIFDVPTFTVVPEPSTMALAGTGLLGIFALRRRRRK